MGVSLLPYKGEFSNKASHVDLIKNPDVQDFLSKCDHLVIPSKEEAGRIVKNFVSPPTFHNSKLPEKIIAIDGSLYESSIDEFVPSTKIGYVKIGSLLIDLEQFKTLRVANNRFVDPFKVAKLKENNAAIPITLPSSNVIVKGFKSVRDSFRAEVDRKLDEFRMKADDPSTSLRTTLFHLAAKRPIGDKTSELGTGDPEKLFLHACPNENCSIEKIAVYNNEKPQSCNCGEPIYASDCLRIWEEVFEYQSNATALSRFMQVMEHLLPIHYIRCLVEDEAHGTIGSFAFIIDGALAIFGPSAWLHASILKFIHDTNKELSDKGHEKIFIMSLIKSGQISEYLNLINKFIPKNKILAVDDDFRYKYITPNRERAKNGFGYETYYGQDFIYKTATDKVFVFNLVYPLAEKNRPDKEFFQTEKVNYNNYQDLAKALALIKEFEYDLYENSLIPIALAHRYTSISLEPGGKILDLLTKKAFEKK